MNFEQIDSIRYKDILRHRQLKNSLRIYYKAYCNALKEQSIVAAKTFAKAYNRTLKALGGAKRNPGEFYLSMGRQSRLMGR